MDDSIIPFIYDGNFMDMVRGREIARYNKSDYTAGITAINAILRFAFELPETDSDAQTYKSMVKYWLSFSSDFVAEFEKRCGLVNYVNYKEIINDDTIIPAKLDNFAKQFNQMDRTVKYGEDYAFGISMSSKNDAANFEHLNGENRKGWYTGDGMVYLYNDDRTQYAGSFWATVDPYRLAGTTVDTRERTRNGSEANYSPQNTFAGGTTLFGSYAVSGMELFAKDATLTAKKSYFMFDDEMVALGAGINSTDSADRTVETIIENRKIKPDISNAVSVNGTERELSDTAEQIPDVKTMHLSGNTPNSDIGYYFPDPVTVNAKKEVRSGMWKDINTYTSYDIDTVFEDGYFTSWIDHGSNPNNAGYSYAVLPNKSAAEVEEYSQTPDYTVLENSKDAQVVKENTLNIIGGNFWNGNTDKTVDVLTVNNPASVMLKLNDNPGEEIEISVSDPSNSNLAQGISIEINKSAKSLISVSDPDKVLVTQLSPTIKLTVLAGSMGETFSATFEEGEGGVIDPPDLPTPTPTPTVSPSPTPTPDPALGQNHGGLLVYDGFNYKTEDYKQVSPATDTVTHKLSGKGSGWKDGWTYYTGASPIPETPQSFEIKTYGTVPFETNIKQDPNNKYMVFRNTHTRELETPINKSNSKTVWVTFLACNNSTNSDAPQLNIYLVNSDGENSIHYSKKGSKNANGKNPWKIRSNGTIFESTIDNSEMNLFVTKIEYDYSGTGEDRALCWINLSDTSSEAALGSPLTVFTAPDLEIASVKVYHDKATTKESFFDEFRIADNLTAALSDTQVMPSNLVYIEDPVIMSDGEVIEDLVVGNVTFKVTLKNYKKEPVDAVVLLALYEGDELVDLITRPLSDIDTVSLEEDINVTSSGQSLKVFVWQDLNTIKPCCEGVEYTFPETPDK